MDKLVNVILCVIAGIGGIGAVFVAVVKFSSNIIAKRLEETFTIEEYKRTTEISEKFNDLNNNIREYLSKLYVLE